MSGWVKVMTNLRSHPKVASVSDGAFRLYIDGLCWAGEHLTDGAIPDYMLTGLAPGLRAKPAKAAAELVQARLWDRVEDGWVIHDYLDVQTSVQTVAKKRKEAAQRMAELRAAEAAQANGKAA